MQQVVLGFYYLNAILQNLSEQDICCFDSNLKDLIDQEGNAMDLYDQCDSKVLMTFISSQEI